MKNIIWGMLISAFVLDIFMVKFFPAPIVHQAPTIQEEVKERHIPNEDYSLDKNEYNEDNYVPTKRSGSLPEKKHYTHALLTVSYCSSLKPKFDEFRKEIIGNYTEIDVNGFEYPAPQDKQFLAKILWYVQMAFIAYLIGGTYIRPHLTFIPPYILDLIDKYKFVLGIFNYFFLSKFITGLTETGAFEVNFGKELV